MRKRDTVRAAKAGTRPPMIRDEDSRNAMAVANAIDQTVTIYFQD